MHCRIIGITGILGPAMKNRFFSSILALTIISVLSACASDRRDKRERPELSSERKAELYERFVRRWDLNADDQVTCVDVNLQRQALFSVLDKDSDTQLTSGEYRYAKFEDKSFLFHLFTDVDVNSSGTISFEELNGVTHSQFTSLDKNGDCLVSELEAEAEARERARDGRERPGRKGKDGPGGRPAQRPNG